METGDCETKVIFEIRELKDSSFLVGEKRRVCTEPSEFLSLISATGEDEQPYGLSEPFHTIPPLALASVSRY